GDAVQGAVAGPVREVADDVVTGERDDPAGAVDAAEPAAELADQQPGGPRVDGEVAVEAGHGGVEQPRADGLAVAHDQRGDVAQTALHPVEDPRRGPKGDV